MQSSTSSLPGASTPPNQSTSSLNGSANPPRSRFASESPISMLVDSLKDRLLFAVPKKGRLYEKALELLAGADIKFNRQHRLDVALVQNHPIALVFLPASDIPRFVALGEVSLGITGQDVIAESGHTSEIAEILPLGFGKCSLQVQVPVSGQIQSVEGLVGRRVATSFEVLAGKYFADADAKAGSGLKTSIEYVGGSVEAACALGMADGIVDLVESGDTMRAAGLKAIATLMTSEAVLITAAKPHQSLTPALEPLIGLVKARIAGVIASKKYVLCNYNVHESKLQQACAITPGRRAATVSKLEESGWLAVSAMVEKKQQAQIMDNLASVGAEDILILSLDNCRV